MACSAPIAYNVVVMGAPRRVSKICAGSISWLFTGMLVVFIRAYQVGIRPLLVGQCKFCPTCSEYFLEALTRHGPLRGGWMGLRRLMRCHPFSSGGIDPVPG